MNCSMAIMATGCARLDRWRLWADRARVSLDRWSALAPDAPQPTGVIVGLPRSRFLKPTGRYRGFLHLHRNRDQANIYGPVLKKSDSACESRARRVRRRNSQRLQVLCAIATALRI